MGVGVGRLNRNTQLILSTWNCLAHVSLAKFKTLFDFPMTFVRKKNFKMSLEVFLDPGNHLCFFSFFQRKKNNFLKFWGSENPQIPNVRPGSPHPRLRMQRLKPAQKKICLNRRPMKKPSDLNSLDYWDGSCWPLRHANKKKLDRKRFECEKSVGHQFEGIWGWHPHPSFQGYPKKKLPALKRSPRALAESSAFRSSSQCKKGYFEAYHLSTWAYCMCVCTYMYVYICIYRY